MGSVAAVPPISPIAAVAVAVTISMTETVAAIVTVMAGNVATHIRTAAASTGALGNQEA
jgi:hypothetical protein